MANLQKSNILTKALSVISGAVFAGVMVAVIFQKKPHLRNQIEEQLRSVWSTTKTVVNRYSGVIQKIQQASTLSTSSPANSNATANNDYNHQWENL
jgi:hypothetical protein